MTTHKPTDSELEILNILWQKGPSSVRTVHEILELSKSAGYTTTLKLMQIMHEKGLVSRNESARTHIYTAAVSKENTQGHFLKKMVDTLFAGNTSQMVMQALGNHKTAKEELDAIRKYLDTLENEK